MASTHGLDRPVSRVRDYGFAGNGALGRRNTDDGRGKKDDLFICRLSVMLKGFNSHSGPQVVLLVYRTWECKCHDKSTRGKEEDDWLRTTAAWLLS